MKVSLCNPCLVFMIYLTMLSVTQTNVEVSGGGGPILRYRMFYSECLELGVFLYKRIFICNLEYHT
jgi:hypothetical protein